jgi:hypothetical protein
MDKKTEDLVKNLKINESEIPKFLNAEQLVKIIKSITKNNTRS